MVVRRPKTTAPTQTKIDEIDTAILDALASRFRLHEKLCAARQLPSHMISYAPDREAVNVRSLLTRKEPGLQAQNLVKIWREIISAANQMYRPFTIAVYTKERPHEMMNLAKDYFGSSSHYLPCISTSQAIQRVENTECGAAVLPLFEHAEESWWTSLSSPEHKHLTIVAKLPFVRTPDYLRSNEAFVVSTVMSEPTGRDKSLFAIEMTCQTSMASLKNLLSECGLRVEAVWPAYNLSRVYLFAVELDGYITSDDDRIVLFQAKNKQNIQMLRRIGGYAEPEIIDVK